MGGCYDPTQHPGPSLLSRPSRPIRSALDVGDGCDSELTGASRAGMDAVLVHAPAVDLNDGRHDDARSWTGPSVLALSEVLGLVE